jgi:broad specificity phosphatase PhoE
MSADTPAPRPTRLLLIRHGESVVTVRRVLGGLRSCVGLSDLGRSQADALRERLDRTGEFGGIDVLYSSTMPRAIETAELIAPALPGPEGTRREIHLDADLCEHDPGEADGLTFTEVVERYGDTDWIAEPYTQHIPGAESIAVFHHRVMGAITRLVARHPGQTVVIACHGGVIDAALRGLLRLPMVGAFELHTLNTSITELVQAGAIWRLVRYNDAAHLAGLPAAT